LEKIFVPQTKILELIPDDAIVDFLKRDLPGNIPKDWNLKIHARSKEFKIHDRGKDKNSLVIHFITSEDL